MPCPAGGGAVVHSNAAPLVRCGVGHRPDASAAPRPIGAGPLRHDAWAELPASRAWSPVL